MKQIKNFVKWFLSFNLIQNFLDKIYYNFFLSDYERSFIAHNKLHWPQAKAPRAEVIADLFYCPDVVIAYSYFLNTLAQKEDASIKSYIFNNGLVHPRSSIIYKSFGVDEVIRVKLTKKQSHEARKAYTELKKKVKTKEDLFNLNFEGIHIGIDIYESFLRDGNKPTLNFEDEKLYYLFESAVKIAIFWRDYFKNHNVVGFITSHESYVWMDIGCRMAYQAKVPVYLPNPRGVTFSKEPFSVYKCLKRYPDMFKMLSLEKQKEGKELAKRQLSKRLGGAIGVDMDYTTETAFKSYDSKNRVLKKSDKTKILIASHCFYDNPHAYDIIPFLDFYEWIHYLGMLSLETDYEWYIKIHPDPLPGTMETIEEIIRDYPQIMPLAKDVSHNQLIDEGINYVLTCYGTIGEEYPLKGVPVLNCAYNPRIAYNFNWHAKDKDELRYMVHNLNSLDRKIDLEEVYEFYFMHRYFLWIDDLIFNSYRDYLNVISAEDRVSGKTYEYFLNEFTIEKHDRTIKNFANFIDSKENYDSVIGPLS